MSDLRDQAGLPRRRESAGGVGHREHGSPSEPTALFEPAGREPYESGAAGQTLLGLNPAEVRAALAGQCVSTGEPGVTRNPSAGGRPAVSVDELRRAWRAVQAGDFRRQGPRGATRSGATAKTGGAGWAPAAGERVVPVIGAAGSLGASTLAVALALAARCPARVVECCSAAASGLAAASTAELGVHATGWCRGRRGQVLLERVAGPVSTVDEVPEPTPAEHDDQLTILDIGWDAGHLAISRGWPAATVRSAAALVVVTTATVPGFRRLDVALELLDAGARPSVDRVALAVVGPRRKKWPRGVERSARPAGRRLLDSGRLVEVPQDRALAAAGLDSRPLPAALTAAAARLLSLTEDLTTSTSAPATPREAPPACVR